MGALEIDLEFAKMDLERKARRGWPETVFCEGKTAGQVAAISKALLDAGQHVLATRAREEQYQAVLKIAPDAVWHDAARAISCHLPAVDAGCGDVLVLSAGTADFPVAEEALLAARHAGAHVEHIGDIGVAGLHRLLKRMPRIRSARVLVVVAGMEGALPSVVAGLVDVPVIAVPTRVGYGWNMEGLTAFATMLNSCAAGVTAVNVDNGYGAGIAAALMNRYAKN